MPSDSVSSLIWKNSPVRPHTLRTNPKSSGSYPFLPKLLKYLYYIIINYSGLIRELKSSKLAFSENLPGRLSETRRRDFGSSELIRKCQNNVISSLLTHIYRSARLNMDLQKVAFYRKLTYSTGSIQFIPISPGFYQIHIFNIYKHIQFTSHQFTTLRNYWEHPNIKFET